MPDNHDLGGLLLADRPGELAGCVLSKRRERRFVEIENDWQGQGMRNDASDRRGEVAAQHPAPPVVHGRHIGGRCLPRSHIGFEHARERRAVDEFLDFSFGRCRRGHGFVLDGLDGGIEGERGFPEATRPEPDLREGRGRLPQYTGTGCIGQNPLVFTARPSLGHQILGHAKPQGGQTALHRNLEPAAYAVGGDLVDQALGIGLPPDVDRLVELLDLARTGVGVAWGDSAKGHHDRADEE